MKDLIKRFGSLLLAASVIGARAPAYAVDLTVQDDTAGDNEAEVELVTDSSQISELVADNWSNDYFGEITISTEDETAYRDGEETSLSDELDITKREANKLMQSAETAEEYINEQTDYEASIDGDGNVCVTDPYQTCRLIVYADSLDSYYGAEQVLYDEDWQKYTLQFATKEQTEAAYEVLVTMLGEENCIVDEVMTQGMLAMDDETTAEDTNSSETVEASGYQAVSWGTKYMGMDVLKSQYDSMSFGASDVTVAIIDSGINANHVLFDGKKITGRSFCGKTPTSKNFSTSNYTDYQGHGTHVAGIISDGTPDNVNIMMLRVFSLYKGELTTTASLVIEAMEYASEHGADVINMSFGEEYDKNDPQTHYNNAIKRLYNSGCVIVAAAGNYDVDITSKSVRYPAVLKRVIAVSAINSGGNFASDYSCHGSQVDFAAPGTQIKSAGIASDEKYVKKNGTSMAAPHVCAAAAYVKMLNPTATPKEVKSILRDYSVDLGISGKDNYYGYGVIDLQSYFNSASSSIASMKLELKYSKMAYTGTERKNSVTVSKTDSSGGETILDSSNYVVTYENNVDIGTATVTVTGTGDYSGVLQTTFRIIPQTVELNQLKNPSKGKLGVYWSTVSRGNGYQVRYSTKSDMSGAKKVTVKGRTTSKYTFSGLKKGRTYYASVRAYKTVNGQKIYGKWSEAWQLTLAK